MVCIRCTGPIFWLILVLEETVHVKFTDGSGPNTHVPYLLEGWGARVWETVHVKFTDGSGPNTHVPDLLEGWGARVWNAIAGLEVRTDATMGRATRLQIAQSRSYLYA